MIFNLSGCFTIPKYLISDYGEYSYLGSHKLKIDGYFYRVDSIRLNGEKHEPEISWFILYRDGTLLQSFQLVSKFKGFDKFENDIFIKPIAGYDYFADSDKKSTWWGAYSIVDNLINFQYFVFFDNWTAIERKGKILNDTTIEMLGTKTLNGYHKDKAMPDFGRFNYRQFQNKPDSLNWMMKDKYYQNKVRTRKMIGEK